MEGTDEGSKGKLGGELSEELAIGLERNGCK